MNLSGYRPIELSAVHLLHVDAQLDQSVGVAPLVVVPADQLHEVVIQRNASRHIEDGRSLAGDEIRGHDLLVSPVQDTLHGPGSRFLDGRHNVVVLGRLLQTAGKVHHGHVRRGHAEGHTGQLAVHGRDHLADGLGGASRGRNNVLGSAAASAPVLATAGGAIHSELGGRHGMHRGHQALDNAELLMHNLGQGSQAIGGAGRVGDHGVAALVVGVVHAHHVHGHRILRGCGDDHLLGAAAQVQLRLLFVGEDARGLANVLGTCRAPRDGRRVLLVEDRDGLAVHHQELLAALLLAVHGSIKGLVHAIILELIDHVLHIHEGVVDGLDIGVGVPGRCAEHQAANAAKAVDAHADWHFECKKGIEATRNAGAFGLDVCGRCDFIQVPAAGIVLICLF